MFTLTFLLRNRHGVITTDYREKVFTDTTVEGAYEMFLIGYGEVLNDMAGVNIMIDGVEMPFLTAKQFRTQYGHIEQKVGDDVTETMMKGGA